MDKALFFILRKKVKSWVYFEGSGLNDIFHWLTHRRTWSKSLFSFTEVVSGSLATKNIEVSSAMGFTFESRVSDKSLICIKKIPKK